MVRKEVQEIAEVFSEIDTEVDKRIIGMEDAKEGIKTALFAGENSHILFEGAPGLGKTELCKAFAATLGIDFERQQFKSDTRASHAIGYTNIEGELVKGPVFTNFYLADEINRAGPKAQSSLLDAMAEGHVTIEELGTMPLPQPFFMAGTQNQVERSGGTQPLPEALQDRFTKKVGIGYPTTEQAIEIAKLNTKPKKELEEINPVTNGSEIITIRNTIEEVVNVSERIYRLAVRMSELTRPEDSEIARRFGVKPESEHTMPEDQDFAHRLKVKVGASPRGHNNLIKAGRVKAVINGRDHVIPRDLIELAFPVFFTRVFFTQKDKSEAPAKLRSLIDIVIKEVYKEGLPRG